MRAGLALLLLVLALPACWQPSAIPGGGTNPFGSSTSSSSGGSGTFDPNTNGTTNYDKLPDTSVGDTVSVYAISDQPAQSMPADKIVRFGASHFAGTEKMTKQAKALFTNYNPKWFQLHYRLGAASGPASFIHNNSWSNWPGTEWLEISTNHKDYFLRDGNGNFSSYDSGDNWYTHDLTNPNMRAWWIQQTIGDIAASDSDGVFGDSYNGAIGCAMTSLCDPRLQNTGANDPALWGGYSYTQQLNDWAAEIQNAFHQEAGSPLFLPNLGALNTEWFFDQFDFDQLDGAFLEGFPDANKNSDFVPSTNYALKMTRADKVVIIQTYPAKTDTALRMFVVSHYLLIKGSRTFLNMLNGGEGDTGFSYYPEYTVKLGSPMSPPPAQISSALNASGVYQRDFQNGIVLVNGTAGTINSSLPAGHTYYKVIASGGGGVSASQLDSSGNLTAGFMSLTSTTVSGSLSMPAWSGAILLNSAP